MKVEFFSSAICLVLTLTGLCLARDCNFDGSCNWNIKHGFIITDFATLNASEGETHPEIYGLANTQGKFAFYDPQSHGDKCKIRTTMIQAIPTGYDLCLTLDVFIGALPESQFMDFLEVTIRSEDSNTDRHKKINVTSENYGKWSTHYLRFPNPTLQFKIVIEAVVSTNETAFLAIDNITLNKCMEVYNCEDDESFSCDNETCIPWSRVCNLQRDCPNGNDESSDLCDVLPTYSFCTFENGTCGWSGGSENNFEWTRYRGPSPTLRTGPSVDHTTGSNNGYYMYIESSEGDFLENAILKGEVMPDVPIDIKASGNCKLRFFYHMWGRSVEELEVSLVDLCVTGKKQLRRMWKMEGDHGDRWHYGEVTVTDIKSLYYLQFEGYGSVMNHGDIAIDDVSFSPGCFGISHNKTNYLTTEDVAMPMDLATFNSSLHCTKTAPHNDTGPTSESMTDTEPPLTMPNRVVEKISIEYVVSSVTATVILGFVMGTGILCFVLRRRRERSMTSGHLEMVSNVSDDLCNTIPITASTFDMQLRCAELNPNYDFITAKYPEQHLREIPRNKLTLIRLLGQGAFGEVYEGTLHNMCSSVKELPVAVKTLPALSTDQAEKDFIMEAVIISKFMHKNVVKCLGVCFEEHPRYIILELLQGGDLKTFLRDSRPRPNQPLTVTMEELVKLALDVANGCRHLEEKHFIHRDIAARNCLLTARQPDRVAKIADFGMSRDIYSADYYRKGGKTMLPIKWMPPEAFLDGVFTTKTDVWSFGVLLWEIFTLGYMPYPGQTNSDVMHFVASGGRLDPPENCPARLNKIMIMCWNSVADIRPSFSEIIEHLDMCLQDPEVMEADPADIHLPMKDCFKDASTLASGNTTTSQSVENSVTSPSDNSTAEFGRHVESQSREPLLPSPDETD